MTYVAPNSVQARDIASLVHPQTNLATHLEEGPVVISRGQGIYVWDDFRSAVPGWRSRPVVRLAWLCVRAAGTRGV